MIKANTGITEYLSKIKMTDAKKLKDRSVEIKERVLKLKD